MKQAFLTHSIFIMIFYLYAFSAFAQENQPQTDDKLFIANYTSEKIIIDGELNEQSWITTPSAQFNFHYNVVNQTDKQATTFRMLWDETNLYLLYHCQDNFITVRETQRDGLTFLDDCAEIFLSPIKNNPGLHFCLEINLNKVSNDIIYLNKFVSGEDVVIKAFNPEYKAAVTIDGTINDNSDLDRAWTMEIAIPLTAFSRISETNPIKPGTYWAFLALRQNRDEINSERRVTSIIYPNLKIENDVHQPQYFGLVKFIK